MGSSWQLAPVCAMAFDRSSTGRHNAARLTMTLPLFGASDGDEDGNPFLAEVTRGNTIESRHRGSALVIDAEGAVVFSAGDIGRPVFPRSAVKASRRCRCSRAGLPTATVSPSQRSRSPSPRIPASLFMRRPRWPCWPRPPCRLPERRTRPMNEAAARALSKAGAGAKRAQQQLLWQACRLCLPCLRL